MNAPAAGKPGCRAGVSAAGTAVLKGCIATNAASRVIIKSTEAAKQVYTAPHCGAKMEDR